MMTVIVCGKRPVFDRLLAKSVKSGADLERFTLRAHTRHVVDAAEAVTASVGRDALASVGLGDEYLPLLQRLVIGGAAFHDFGKANDNFQFMIRTPGDRVRQALRHEAVTVLGQL